VVPLLDVLASVLSLNLCTDEFTDDVFDAHEAEVKKLEVQLDALRPILQLIQRRHQILREKQEYEVMLQNPNRYLSFQPDPSTHHDHFHHVQV
jgi:hypothetical protein